MRGIVFHGDRRLELVTVADPVPTDGEVVIEIKASGMCGTDLHKYRGPSGEARSGDRRSRAGRRRRLGRPGRRSLMDRATSHGAPLLRMRQVRPVPLGLDTAVSRRHERHGQHGPWVTRRPGQGARVHAGADAGGALVPRRSRDRLRYRHGLGSTGAHAAGRFRHARGLRPGTGRPGCHSARERPWARASSLSTSPPARLRAIAGVRRLGDGQSRAGRLRRGRRARSHGRSRALPRAWRRQEPARRPTTPARARPVGNCMLGGVGSTIHFDLTEHLYKQVTAMTSWTMSLASMARCADVRRRAERRRRRPVHGHVEADRTSRGVRAVRPARPRARAPSCSD